MSQYSTPLWGEIPHIADTDSGIAALEREQITKPRPLEIEGPPLHQPSSRHRPPTNEVLPSEHFKMDPVVIHTIRLLNHVKRLHTAIDILRSDVKQETDASLTSVGPIPEYEGPPIKDRSSQKYFAEEEYETNFVRGMANPPPPIDDLTCRKLLRRSTCAILAHLSFDTAKESVVDTMTDLCHQFLVQFTKHMGAAADRKAQYGADGFPDIVERTFHEMGLGSVADLHDFYQQRVLTYHKQTLERCQALMQEYTTLSRQQQMAAGLAGTSSSDAGGSDTLHVIRIKEEPSNDIQFPLLDENSEVNEAEQLLNIESLGTFEITVEHETATGLTTEVESKWSHGGKASDAKSRQQAQAALAAASAATASTTPATTPSEETPGADNPTSTQHMDPSSVPGVRTPLSNSVPRTPQSNSAPPATPQAPTPREYSSIHEDSAIQEPGSISSMDIFSPSVPTPSIPKKKKKS
ncbi:staga complex 65 subunit gamma [Plakobranchus ocellatus]|uniref:Staga complex 65 subunit gamma n=1 Tax=Plakobranchus ocellatus TaxID=259542 RepID=A0AAV3XWV0_9GAST|nr:staga complex 65 subunit gamma [Plakobranchus ocellatus]